MSLNRRSSAPRVPLNYHLNYPLNFHVNCPVKHTLNCSVPYHQTRINESMAELFQREGINSMKRAVLLLALLLALVLWTVSVPANLFAQQVITYSDRDSIKIGEVFHISYVITRNADRISYPDASSFEGDFTVRKVDRFRTNSGADSLVYTLQNFENEDLVIPSQRITLQIDDTDTTLTTNRIPLFFKSAVSDTVTQFQLRPIRDNFEFKTPLWMVLLVIVFLAAAIFFGWRYLKNYLHKVPDQREPRAVFNPKPFSDPLEKLHVELQKLGQTRSFQSHEEADKFYIALGDAIREYLKTVYKFPALEMTSPEILENMAARYATPGTMEKTRRVLMEADMVKFARLEPDEHALQAALQSANEFVRSAMTEDRHRIEEMKRQHEMTENQRREQFENTDEKKLLKEENA